MGPNRFEGLGRIVTDDADVNEEVLADDPRVVRRLLVLDVRWVAQPGCTLVDLMGADAEALAQALTRAARASR